MACHFGVWDEGYNFDRSTRHNILVETERSDFCFWWPFRPGMLFPAAMTMQERKANLVESAHDRKLTSWGLWIAAIALIANLAVSLVDLFATQKWWPFH